MSSLVRVHLTREEVSERARVALVKRWSVVPESIREAALGIDSMLWRAAVVEASTSEDPLSRSGAAAFIRETGVEVGQILGLLHDPASAVVEASEAALLTRVIAGFRGGGVREEAQEAALAGAVARAASAFGTHKRPGAILSAIMMASRTRLREEGDPLSDWFKRETRLSGGASRGLLRSAKAGIFRLRAWEWLSRLEWASAAQTRLSMAESVDDHEQVLCAWHLLLHPARGARAQAIVHDGESRLLPRRGELHQLSPTARLGAMRMAIESGASARERAELSGAALTDGDVLVRLCATNGAPSGELQDFQFDRDSRVARRAMLKSSAVGEPARLAGSRQAAAGASAAKRLSALRRGRDVLVASWASQELHRLEVAARLGLLRCVQGSRSEASRVLAERVEAGTALEAIEALGTARRAGVIDDLSESVEARMRTGGDSRVTASCVAALGESTRAQTVEVLMGVLAHEDGRVRANAVESLARTAGRSGGASPLARVFELKGDSHHRVQANVLRAAIASGFEVEEAWDSMQGMLESGTAAVRLAGTWLASRVLPSRWAPGMARRWEGSAHRVMELSSKDEHAGVRDRARALSELLNVEGRGAVSGAGGVFSPQRWGVGA